MKKKIAFIINPRAGSGKKGRLAEPINRHLDISIFKHKIVETKYPGQATELARDFVSRAYDCVVAVGGDGTTNEVARALIHTDTALGIIPEGSGNGLARHLGIPVNTIKAIEHLNFSETIMMDYGTVNDRPFFCTCGTGFDAYISEQFSKSKKRGALGYLEKMVANYITYTPQNYHIIADGIDMRNKALVITFANASQWGNNAYIAPHASVQDGMLEVSIMSKFPIIAFPALAINIFTKNIDNDWFVSTLRSNELKLMREMPGPFHVDGEPYQEGTELTIKVIPDGLKVKVKKRF
jgi:diacylglycerol kinase (ATP)